MQDFGIDPSFGQLVEQEMKRRGDTRAVAAEAMDISTSMLSDLLTGQPRNYSMTSLKKICEYAHLSADRILGLPDATGENAMLNSTSYITGLSPKAVELLSSYNISEWALETKRAKVSSENALRRKVSNKLLEYDYTYLVLSMITEYFDDVERMKETARPESNQELKNAIDVLDRNGYRVLSRPDVAQITRQAVLGLVDILLQECSGEVEWRREISEG